MIRLKDHEDVLYRKRSNTSEISSTENCSMAARKAVNTGSIDGGAATRSSELGRLALFLPSLTSASRDPSQTLSNSR